MRDWVRPRRSGWTGDRPLAAPIQTEMSCRRSDRTVRGAEMILLPWKDRRPRTCRRLVPSRVQARPVPQRRARRQRLAAASHQLWTLRRSWATLKLRLGEAVPVDRRTCSEVIPVRCCCSRGEPCRTTAGRCRTAVTSIRARASRCSLAVLQRQPQLRGAARRP